VVLYGASGHAKVIIDILESNDIKINKIYDDDIDLDHILSYPVELPPENLNMSNEEMIICVGYNDIRKKISLKYPVKYAKAIHPSAQIGSKVKIDDGTVIMANTVVNSSTTIGAHVIINTSASVDHDCVIGDYVHISPNSCLCGCVEIGEGTQIGAGSVVIPGVKIGKWSVIGAGAVVIHDIPDHVVVVGNPVKIIKNIVNHEK
jgi:acetyltransferase EpsM